MCTIINQVRTIFSHLYRVYELMSCENLFPIIYIAGFSGNCRFADQNGPRNGGGVVFEKAPYRESLLEMILPISYWLTICEPVYTSVETNLKTTSRCIFSGLPWNLRNHLSSSQIVRILYPLLILLLFSLPLKVSLQSHYRVCSIKDADFTDNKLLDFEVRFPASFLLIKTFVLIVKQVSVLAICSEIDFRIVDESDSRRVKLHSRPIRPFTYR